MRKIILAHYSEIGLKKTNIPYFVKKLVLSVRAHFLADFGKKVNVKVSLQRFLIEVDEGWDEEACAETMQKIFGIRNFGFFYVASLDYESLLSEILAVMSSENSFAGKTFVVRVKRSQKYDLNSTEMERRLGADLLKSASFAGVNLHRPDVTLQLEIFNGHCYFSFRRFEGSGGLPTGSEKRMLALISAGFDSPVAAWRMMRRGVLVDFLHFHSYPYTDEEEMQNVKELVAVLQSYQFNGKLYFAPFADFQKMIATTLDIPAKYRVLLYRRMMLKVAERLGRKLKSTGIITGDSLGQVASQTPENLLATSVTDLPVYRPLIACDKEEILALAAEIGTWEISSRPCKDTCAMFSAKKPEIRAEKGALEGCETFFDFEEELGKILRQIEVVKL